MSVFRVVTLAVLAAAGAAPLGGPLGAPLLAQVPRRVLERGTTTPSAPRLMVANPYPSAGADSTIALRIGSGMRGQMKNVVDDEFQIVPDSLMGSALQQYGFAQNAALTPSMALTLAKNIQARVLLGGTMQRTKDGQYSVTARLVGVNDQAGYVLTTVQQPKQSPANFGEQIAKRFKPAIEALDNAKECVNLRTEKPDKARDAANKALKKLPNQGLAEYCLAQIAIDKKAPRAEVVKHLQAAVKGDPLSLPAWTALATQYQQAGDSANTILAFKQMLLVAPTNQKLREEAFRLFLNYGATGAARQVADEGLALDPQNADLYDLKSNACLFANDFRCAVDALEKAYAVDSTLADTLFLTKITVAAAQQPDTARLLKWSRIAVQKYPKNVTLLGQLNQAYALSGQTDSSLAVTTRLIAVDSNAVVPALAAAQALASAKRLNEATPYIEFVQQRGDPTQKQQLAVILVNAALPLLQEPQDLVGAADLARQALALADSSGKLAPSAHYILGLATFFQIPKIDPEAESQKSCELAQQEQTLLDDAETHLTAGQSAKPEAVAQYLEVVEKYKPRVSSMETAYCKEGVAQ